MIKKEWDLLSVKERDLWRKVFVASIPKLIDYENITKAETIELASLYADAALIKHNAICYGS